MFYLCGVIHTKIATMSNLLYQFSPHGMTASDKAANLYLRFVGSTPISNLKCYTADQLPSGVTFHIKKKKYKTAKGFLKAITQKTATR